MAINISEQFIVNVALPVDSRIVASNSTALNAIAFKYDGLKVFQQDTRETYVWNESLTNWILDGVSGSGENNNVLKWNGGLTSSNISSIGQFVGINTNNPVANLQIDGTGQPFVIQKDNGTIIANNWYNDGSDQFFNNSQGSGAIKFRSNGEIWILSRDASGAAINSTDGSTFSAVATFNINSIVLRKNTDFNTGARIRANTTSSASSPDYSWVTSNTTGLFLSSSNSIGISINSSRQAIINATGLLLSQNTSISGPSAKLHIDSGNGASSFLKFTAGTTTGIGTNNGFDIGTSDGFPILISRNNLPILFNFLSGSSYFTYYSFSRDNFSYYPTGTFPSVLETATRIVTGSFIKEFSTAATHIIGTFSVPNNSQVSVEATFISSLNTTPRQFRNNKTVRQYTVNNTGTIIEQGTSGVSLYNLASSSSSDIKTGLVDFLSPNILRFRQQTTSAVQSSLMVKYEISINTSRGHI
jgi:hypothetical protein